MIPVHMTDSGKNRTIKTVLPETPREGDIVMWGTMGERLRVEGPPIFHLDQDNALDHVEVFVIGLIPADAPPVSRAYIAFTYRR